MRRDRTEDLDPAAVRAAVAGLVDSDRYSDWLVEVPDQVLVALVAPLEMLAFQYYLEPAQDRHLVRAARVVCESMKDVLDDCPDDLAKAFTALGEVVLPRA